ncbi:MAG TPA: phenylalanine--tRNA ligase subunit beta [Planctomycetes bacterium]|nr:phenylalanine--tRNA ligase subunit beta [Planctomycetota bacterium]
MPTISCSEHDLLGLIGEDMDRARLLSLLPLAKAGFDGEEDGKLRIELQDTNRPDLWSCEGVARQLRAHLRGATPSYPFFRARAARAGGRVEVDADLAAIRPVVGAFIARGVEVDEATLIQIIQTQEKLCEGYGHKRREAAMGVYDASAIEFPVRYRAAAPDETRFVPLGFEQPMTLNEILRDHPKGRDYRRLVEGKPRYPLLEDSAGTVLSFPPVINSRALGEVEVGDDNLFVEVTGHDLRIVALVLNIMACNFADRGWTIVPITAVYPYDTAFGREVTIPMDLSCTQEVPLAKVNKALGLALAGKEVQALLRSYGVAAKLKAGGIISATSPAYRADYMHPVDVIEDIAIARGYERFEPVMPETFTVGGLAPSTLLADRARQELVGYGFQEVFSNVLMSREETRARLRIDAPLVEIENFVSDTYSVVRDRLLVSLLRVESSSTKAQYPHQIFEVGEVAVYDESAVHGSRTEDHAAALMASGEAGFSDIHSYLDALMYFLARDYRLESRDMPFAIEGRGAVVRVGEKEVGVIAELHPEVLVAWGMEAPAAYFEINLSALA